MKFDNEYNSENSLLSMSKNTESIDITKIH